ncbi:hypothetical protein [Noviherbaspirillum aerium]|uniref:hypothetical protein n=1 Tax=Noviherbaspirillum aerium TaxID=2588497 RepID=UPI00124DCFAA|nr:hypothetical protein [Noviherbaspirillum aerium]
MTKDISLVTCEVHFDQGQVLDLLQPVRSKSELQEVPFLLASGRETNCSPAILQGIETVAESLGATAHINVLKLVSSMGEENAYEDIRRIVRKRILLDSLNQSISFLAKANPNDWEGEGPRAA